MRTASMRDRLLALEARKADLERMAEPERMPRLQPKLAEAYRQQVERLEESLNDPAIRPEAADALRSLIDRIVLYPGERRGEVQADLHGELGAILAFSQGGGSKNSIPLESRVRSQNSRQQARLSRRLAQNALLKGQFSLARKRGARTLPRL
jgi:hypothetical protein